MVIAASLATTRLSHIPPRILVTVGMALGALSMLYLTRLEVSSSYGTDMLPSLVGMGVALGLIFAPAMNNATLGLHEDDAGVGSAMATTSQQIGGAIGTALLSTMAASATASWAASASGAAAASSDGTAAALSQATVHGYTMAFTWSAGLFLFGAVVAVLLFPRGVAKGAATEKAPAEAEPVPAH